MARVRLPGLVPWCVRVFVSREQSTRSTRVRIRTYVRVPASSIDPVQKKENYVRVRWYGVRCWLGLDDMVIILPKGRPASPSPAAAVGQAIKSAAATASGSSLTLAMLSFIGSCACTRYLGSEAFGLHAMQL